MGVPSAASVPSSAAARSVPSLPSASGLLLDAVVASVQTAIAGGRISRVQVEVQLEAAHIGFLDEKPDPARPVPVDVLGSMAEVLAGILGGMPDDTLRRLGAAAARTIRRSGRYPQAAFDRGSLVSGDPGRMRAFAAGVAGLWPALCDFGRTRIEGDPARGGFDVHYEGVSALPESLRHGMEGLTAAVVAIASHGSATVTSERPSPDRFATHIVLPDASGPSRGKPAGGPDAPV